MLIFSTCKELDDDLNSVRRAVQGMEKSTKRHERARNSGNGEKIQFLRGVFNFGDKIFYSKKL